MNNDNQHHESNHFLREAGVPDGADDLRAQWLQKYMLEKNKVPEHLGITIRVTKKQNRYYVSEWRTGRQTFSGETIEHPIARLSPIRGKSDQWQLAWMRSDGRWHDLDKTYRGTFEYCADLIVKDPGGCFWG